MSIEQVAQNFFNAVKEDNTEAYQAMWSDDIVSMEPGNGPMNRVEGREQLLEKHAWWNENAEMHGFEMAGPFVVGEQFAVNYSMDVTMMGERSQSSETAIYTVQDGKIAEERFFYEAAEMPE
ncbi:SnoaL-like domain-containing protein [Qipengyuania sp. DGS5-3]|uniref:SnoaL-like domain-containing protein n=1 Tax=Qipengyuania sp. DGS5-3 TaxID=3349632 RepID=UPI0036D2E682